MPVPVIDMQQQALNQLPSEQRKEGWEIFATAQQAPNVRLYTLFTYLMNGSTDSGYWDGTATYAKGDLVRTLYGVYESLTDGNFNNAVTDTNYWLKVLDSFIGATERARFNGRYLNLTWALNRIFGTTFRQPPYPSPYGGSGTFSDIYITNDDPEYFSIIGFTDLHPENSSYSVPAGYFAFTDLVTGTASSYKFTIFFPTAVFTALGATDPIRESVVRAFVDRLVPSGISYNIDTY